MRETIKNIIANILYLDSTEEISDRVALFTELSDAHIFSNIIEIK